MILVTGGAGFIGSNIVKGLVEKGQEVVVYDLFPNTRRLGAVADRIEFVKGDVIEWETMLEAIRKYNVKTVVHLAYYLDLAEQGKHPEKVTRINCLGFNNILEVARLSNVKRFVWASSAAVYGPPEKYSGPVNEDAALHPTTLYGACKVYNEYLARHYRQQFGLETIGLRPAIVYGEGRWYSGFSSFARDLFVNALKGRPSSLMEGDKRVDWINVKDVTQAFIKACFVDRVTHDVFNLQGEVASVRRAAEIVQELVPSAQIKIHEGGRELWPAVLDWSRAREELGYKPEYGLKRGIAEYLEALRKDPDESGN